MSTNYYRFKTPITSIRVKEEGQHKKISIWVNHQLSGTLVLDDASKIAEMFVDRDRKVFHAYFAGEGAGMVANCFDKELSHDEWIISEDLEVVQAKDLFERVMN